MKPHPPDDLPPAVAKAVADYQRNDGATSGSDSAAAYLSELLLWLIFGGAAAFVAAFFTPFAAACLLLVMLIALGIAIRRRLRSINATLSQILDEIRRSRD